MGRRRRRHQDEEEEEEEEEDEDGDYGGGIRGTKRRMVEEFLDMQADVDDDGEEDEDEDSAENDFIDDKVEEVDMHDEPESRRLHRRPLLPFDQEDDEELERQVQQRYHSSSEFVEDEGSTGVDQQALLPSVRDPKLWLVKCAIGHEREVAACLMQKCIDTGSQLQIMSAIALDHLKNFIYIEAEKEAHVREACKGMRYIYSSSKIVLVPVKEMTDILSVESKTIDLCEGTWVRMKIGTYKGDLAQVVDLDDVRRRVTVKLIPRIDLQSLADKLEGLEVSKKKLITPRLLNIDEARAMNIQVVRRRDRATGDYYDNVNGMMFKDGFLHKTVSTKSVSTQNIQPSFDELDKFRQSNQRNGDTNMDIESMPSLDRKKVHFTNGDRVLVTKGDLQNLNGWVEKVEEEIVHIRPNAPGLPKSLAVNRREVCRYIEPGNHVKVITGAKEGTTGMVAMVQGNLVKIVVDQTNEVLPIPIDNVAELKAPVSLPSAPVSLPLPPASLPQPSGRVSRGGPAITGGRNRVGTRPNSLIGTSVKVLSGPYKGYKGRVVDVKGASIRVELESQMKVIIVDRSSISDKINVSTLYSDTSRYGSASETPMLYGSGSGTPMRHGSATPMRYASGSETPMRYGSGNGTPMRHGFGSETPMPYGSRSGTPMRHGSATPMRYGSGSETPIRYGSGSETPIRHDSGSGTPVHYSSPMAPQGGGRLESLSPEVGINAY